MLLQQPDIQLLGMALATSMTKVTRWSQNNYWTIDIIYNIRVYNKTRAFTLKYENEFL
jgi:hypothetical protein